MAGNSYGKIFKITTFGESHGIGIGAVIDGCPAGVPIDEATIQYELDRRRPGQSAIVTQRKEPDTVQIISGIFEGKTTGTPIMLYIANKDQKSRDYDHIKDRYRPSHAGYVYDKKYGFRDYRGGGRSSARETAARVAVGAIAKKFIESAGIHVKAYVDQVGELKSNLELNQVQWDFVEKNPVRSADPAVAKQMEDYIKQIKKEGDTIGGVIKAVITGCPAGLGEPVFDKLHAELGKAMLSINAVKGFEYGSGFAGVAMRGSQHNDLFTKTPDNKITTSTNYSGGIQGGISNGLDIYFGVAFKPVATIMRDQQSIDKEGNEATVTGKGRHDPCVVPRAVPIVEAMGALVIADFLLRLRSSRV